MYLLLVAMEIFTNKGGRHSLKGNLAWEEIMIQFRNIKSQANTSKFLEIQWKSHCTSCEKA